MILNNCKVKWAKVHQVDRTFTPRWTINVYLSPEQLSELKTAAVLACEGRDYPLNMRHDDDGTYINATRNEKKQDGQNNRPPRVVGMDKQPFTLEIGNGSICNVIVTPFEYKFAGKPGVKILLDAVQVVTHVEYTGGEDFPDAPEMATANGEGGDGLPF